MENRNAEEEARVVEEAAVQANPEGGGVAGAGEQGHGDRPGDANNGQAGDAALLLKEEYSATAYNSKCL
jgi:hypothetical protein